MSNTKIYLASPFFNEKEVEKMEKVKGILRAKGLDVFVPNEHQNKHLEFGSVAWRKATFDSDVNGIDASNCIVAIVDGNYMDSGTAWEIGYASANNIPVVVVNVEGDTINLMIADSLHAVITSYEELEAYDFEDMPKIPYLNYVW